MLRIPMNRPRWFDRGVLREVVREAGRIAAWRMPWQKSGNDDTGGVNSRLFPAVPGQSTKDVAAAPLYPAMRAWPYGFSVMWLSAVCGLCVLHLSRAGVDARVRFAAAVTRSLLPSAVIFRSFARSGFAASPCNSRQPCASGCGFPCALHPRLFARLLWRHGTPGVAEYVNNGGNIMQYAKPVTLNVEECDRLSFLPYLFGNDFLYAEAYVYALAQK
ncbi:DUF1472 domain-containing protein (plasmid) [Escherichia fergusonii]|nr:DUF1472 domain-containing protein [Escherichia fergusonii]